MDKRYQVFVSSTYEDLQEERQEVMQALLELDCIVSGMELFPAANEDQWTLIKKVIEECDYYLVIIGGRYGSIGPEGISYTEMEYRFAESIKKPIIAFLHNDLSSIPAGKSETDQDKREKLEKFREYARRKMCKLWSNPTELGSVISRSMVKLMKTTPAIGWIRANEISDPERDKENIQLRKKIEELEQELRTYGSKGPEGIEGLSQGDDKYELKFNMILVDDPEYYKQKQRISRYYFNGVSWNDIIKVTLPRLIPEGNEKEIRAALHEFRTLYKDGKITEEGVVWHVNNQSLDEKSLTEIIIQLHALGLIVPSIGKRRSLTDTAKYWKLTSYGENIMNKVCAVRKTTS